MRTLRRLLAKLVVRTVKNADQRARFELFSHGGNVLQSLRLAEHPHEAVALGAGAAKHAPLAEDDGPGHHTKGQQDDQDGLGDESAGLDQARNFTADRGGEEHTHKVH